LAILASEPLAGASLNICVPSALGCRIFVGIISAPPAILINTMSSVIVNVVIATTGTKSTGERQWRLRRSAE
jgi:hypothetical protein